MKEIKEEDIQVLTWYVECPNEKCCDIIILEAKPRKNEEVTCEGCRMVAKVI